MKNQLVFVMLYTPNFFFFLLTFLFSHFKIHLKLFLISSRESSKRSFLEERRAYRAFPILSLSIVYSAYRL